MKLQSIVACLNNLADGNDVGNSSRYIYNEAHAANARIAELEKALRPLAEVGKTIDGHYHKPEDTYIWAEYGTIKNPVRLSMADAIRAALLLDGDK